MRGAAITQAAHPRLKALVAAMIPEGHVARSHVGFLAAICFWFESLSANAGSIFVIRGNFPTLSI